MGKAMDPDTQEAEDELIASLLLEHTAIRRITSFLRSDHKLTKEEMEQHLELSFSRRYSLYQIEKDVVER